ncbi:MAG: endonuclease/exonuclease/phosphatase family protein [Balneolales bacterium]
MNVQSNVLVILFSFLLFAMTGCTGNEAQESASETIMSYNIRYNTSGDGINAWPHRKDNVAEMIGIKYQAGIAGLQEALKGQIDDLQDLLPEYAWVGAGRDDGEESGEFSPIFYRPDRYNLLEHDTFWLSETPEVPGSMSWDTAITRVVTWAKFQVKDTDKEFYFFNTHFDHRGQQARLESARLLADRVSEIPDNIPVIITGDFNTRETTDVYAVMVDLPNLYDARYVSETDHEGPTSTSNNWVELRGPESRIDYIFVREGIRVLNHRFPDDRYDGRFPSDHLPVVAEIELP